MSSNPRNYMEYGVETIKRQSRRMRLAVGHRSACGRRLSLRPMPYASSLCVLTSASAVAVCDLRRYTVLYAFALALLLLLLLLCLILLLLNVQQCHFLILGCARKKTPVGTTKVFIIYLFYLLTIVPVVPWHGVPAEGVVPTFLQLFCTVAQLTLLSWYIHNILH